MLTTTASSTNATPYNARDPKDAPTADENDTVLTRAAFDTNIVKVSGDIATGYTAVFTIAATTAEVDATGSLGRPNTQAGGRNGQPPAP